MNINLFPLTIAWMFLAAVVIGLIIYRAWVASGEDDRLHVNQSEIGMVSRQATISQKLESIDRWGQMLTVVVLLYGLAMAAGYIYQNLVR